MIDHARLQQIEEYEKVKKERRELRRKAAKKAAKERRDKFKQRKLDKLIRQRTYVPCPTNRPKMPYENLLVIFGVQSPSFWFPL